VLEQATDPFSRIAAYYEGLVQKYGHDPRACDYGRPKSQELKFRVLSEAMALEACSVLDVGCGFADFCRFLQGRFQDVRYRGIDICPAMVEEAHRLDPSREVSLGNILESSWAEQFDLVTANGIFYLLGDEAWSTMKKIIRRMYEAANVAVAFNSLSAWAEDKEAGEFYANPVEVLEFCRTLTPWVVLRHDYHPRDFTIYMYKSART
jgi:SAM-dependent methyltransferase